MRRVAMAGVLAVLALLGASCVTGRREGGTMAWDDGDRAKAICQMKDICEILEEITMLRGILQPDIAKSVIDKEVREAQLKLLDDDEYIRHCRELERVLKTETQLRETELMMIRRIFQSSSPTPQHQRANQTERSLM